MIVADPSKASSFELTGNAHRNLLTVKANDATEAFTTSITFRVNNEYEQTDLFTASFVVVNCVNFGRAKAASLDESITVPSPPADLTLDLASESLPVSISWDEFEFSASLLDLCPIDSYQVTCTDPSGGTHVTDYEGAKQSGDSTQCNTFTY